MSHLLRALGLFLILATTSAAACTVKPVRGWDAQIDPAKINAKLISQSITAYTNQARCASGRSALKYDKNLTKASDIHSAWMAKASTMTHTQNVGKHRDLVKRLKASRSKFKVTAAENIGRMSRMTFQGSNRFKIIDASACKFAISNNAPIPPRSYENLAQEIVALWMTSPTHKKNILKSKVKRHGAMIGFDPKGKHCGDFYITQVFAG